MRNVIIFVLIIAILPLSVMAHAGQGSESDEQSQQSIKDEAGVLPGELFYFLDRAGEWIEVNLLTPSTKQKQFRRVEFTNERIAELFQLTEIDISKKSAYETGLKFYQLELNRAEDMAEKILILDGIELPLAENFEAATREQERRLHNLLELVRPEFSGAVMQAISASRIENRKMFNYMVKNYQFTEEDIEKHRFIVREHISYIQTELGREDLVLSEQQQERVDSFFKEANKFLEAGLNIEAYEYMDQVKNVFYSRLGN